MSALFDSLVGLSVDKLVKAGAVSNDDSELYRYSVEVALLKVFHFISYFAISCMMHRIMECIIIIIIFYAFRRNVGGYHARTRIGCYFFSCFTIMISLYLAGFNLEPGVQVFLVFGAFIVMILLPPVHNENRLVSMEEDTYFRRRLRIFSAIFILLFGILAIFGLWKYTWICTIGLLLAASLMILGKLQNVRDGKVPNN